MPQLVIQENGTPTNRDAIRWETGPTQFTFTNTRGQRGTATVPLRIPPGMSYTPLCGWPVFIYETDRNTNVDTCVFVGTIDSIEIDFNIGDYGWHAITLTLTSLEQMFDTVQGPTQEFTNTDAGTIFTALFDSVVDSLPVPVTLGTVDAGVSISDRKYDSKSSVATGFTQLATDSAFIWYIDPRDQKIYFHAHDTRPAPFVLTGADMLWETIKWTQSRADFANVQVIQLNPDTLPADNIVFAGDGLTNVYTLPYPVTQVTRAFLTIATQAQVIGTFTGQPSPGDTITITPPYSPVITPPSYTFVTAIDNTAYGQVLIGATAADSYSNLTDAINGKPGTAGIEYSFPTWNNQAVTAKSDSTTITITAKQLGPSGNSIAVSESTANFTFPSTFLSGGASNKSQELSVGPLLSGEFDLGYTPGSTQIQLQQQPAVGVNLSVDFYGAMTGTVTVQNAAAAALGIGSQFSLMRARNVSTGADAIQQATAALAAYSILPAQFQWGSYRPGLFCGSFLTADIGPNPVGASGLLDGNWLMQQVQGTWTPGMGGLDEPYPHFNYTYLAINTTQVSTYIDTLAQLASTGDIKTTPPGSSTQTQPAVLPGDTIIPFQRTLLLKDVTPGVNIADNVVVYTRDTGLSPVTKAVAQGVRIVAVLRKIITSDLTVRFNKITNSSPPTTTSWTVTVPAGSALDLPLSAPISGAFHDLDVLVPDIIASDGQAADAAGIASFTIEWE